MKKDFLEQFKTNLAEAGKIRCRKAQPALREHGQYGEQKGSDHAKRHI